jgi:hypothetical protein
MQNQHDDGGPVFRRADGSRIPYHIMGEGEDTWIAVASEADRRIILKRYPRTDVRVDEELFRRRAEAEQESLRLAAAAELPSPITPARAGNSEEKTPIAMA